jgi:cyclic pyranopterin phosphate synthase
VTEVDDPHGPSRLSHVDDQGRAQMVDVSSKAPTLRTARAAAIVRVTAPVRQRLLAGDLPKGEALAVARVAGIQAAKETSRLLPLCHPLPLSFVGIEFAPIGDDGLAVSAEARTTAPTGVEMEAMTAAATAALCVYDLVKGLCRQARIESIELRHKSGGRSGTWDRPTA